MTKVTKPAGRKRKAEKDKVKSKGVYLTQKEWDAIEKVHGSGTLAMRSVVLPKLSIK